MSGTHESPRDDRASLGRDRFEADELREVLAAFPLSGIKTMREFDRGSRWSPKLTIEASEGTFLLKRRADRADLRDRVQWNHAIIAHLERDGLPVAHLVRTWDQNSSMLFRNERVYELFEYLDGRRWDRSEAETHRAGRALGLLHTSLASFDEALEPPGGTFHGSDIVASAFGRLATSITSVVPTVDVARVVELAEELRGMYRTASRAAVDAGFETLPIQPIHGDWHPGNVLFVDAPGGGRPGSVVAVVDFDASRAEPRIIDLANGVLHFGMRSVPDKSPAEWPHTLSARRMQGFLEGWRLGVGRIENREALSLPWLMIEAVIAESVVPIAENGCFSTVPGLPFLEMVRSKAAWIESRSKAITGLLKA